MDIRTLTILSVAIILGFGVALWIFSRADPKGDGPRVFAAAFGFLAAGVFLVSFRGLAPDLVTVIAANGLECVGLIGVWRGARVMAGLPARRDIEAGILVAYTAAMAYWTYAEPDIQLRVVASAVMATTTNFLAFRESIRLVRTSRRRAGGLLIAVFTVFTAYSAFRGVATLFEGEIPDFMHAGFLQATAILVLIFGSAALSFAILWATLAGMTEELSAANQGLARSNEQLERFARVVSHDLRDPLATARGYVDLLLGRHRNDLGERPHSYVEEIGAAMDRCMRLVDDVLFLSRLKASARSETRISLSDACAEAIGNLSAAVAPSGARIKIAPLPEIVGAHGQFVRLFQNLVGNSIRYRDPDRILEIRIEAAQDGAVWRIAVIDNGRGFDAAPRESSPHPDSTGLGLSICRRIVANHGGRLWIESVPELGTTVSFTVVSGRAGG